MLTRVFKFMGKLLCSGVLLMSVACVADIHPVGVPVVVVDVPVVHVHDDHCGHGFYREVYYPHRHHHHGYYRDYRPAHYTEIRHVHRPRRGPYYIEKHQSLNVAPQHPPGCHCSVCRKAPVKHKKHHEKVHANYDESKSHHEPQHQKPVDSHHKTKTHSEGSHSKPEHSQAQAPQKHTKSQTQESSKKKNKALKQAASNAQ